MIMYGFLSKSPPTSFQRAKDPCFLATELLLIYHIFVMILISRIYGMKTKYKNRRKYQYKHFTGLNAKNLAVSNNFPMDQANLDIIFVKISLNQLSGMDDWIKSRIIKSRPAFPPIKIYFSGFLAHMSILPALLPI